MIRYLTATVLALVFCCGVEATPAHAQPITVDISVYLSDILKYDPTSGFTVDGYLGFFCDQPCGDLKLIVYNLWGSAGAPLTPRVPGMHVLPPRARCRLDGRAPSVSLRGRAHSLFQVPCVTSSGEYRPLSSLWLPSG